MSLFLQKGDKSIKKTNAKLFTKLRGEPEIGWGIICKNSVRIEIE